MLPRLKALNKAIEAMIALAEAEERAKDAPDIPDWLYEQEGARPPAPVEMVYLATRPEPVKRAKYAHKVGCPVCGNPLQGRKQKFCSGACKQSAYRKRLKFR